ncbi:uncharacterized homolog isoform X2 [Salminus brasiliensis]|uniref:uncharacterized homolog isoform X2 n=1 Tax=Salminus brasiliensis TaxID=930266 RepID=UPI003B82F5A0
MAKMMHAIAVLILASGSSLLALSETTPTTPSVLSARSESTSTSTTARAEPETSSLQSATHATSKPSAISETHGATKQSSEPTTQTSTLRTGTTAEPHRSNSPETTTTHSTVTGHHSESATTDSHGGNGSVPERTTQVTRNDSTGTTVLVTTKQLSTKAPNKTASADKVNTTPTSASQGNSLARNPGLVAVLCIFFIVLALVLVVVIAKVITTCRKPKFERLDDLPMSKMREDSPFARYPPN